MIFFDTEIYHNYFLALFKFEGENGQSHIFEANDKDNLKAFIAANQHETFVSFNGIGFDVPIINAFLAGKPVDIVKFIADRIIEKEMRPEHLEKLAELLAKAGVTHAKPEEFKRYGSARKLYNFNIDNADAY